MKSWTKTCRAVALNGRNGSLLDAALHVCLDAPTRWRCYDVTKKTEFGLASER